MARSTIFSPGVWWVGRAWLITASPGRANLIRVRIRVTVAGKNAVRGLGSWFNDAFSLLLVIGGAAGAVYSLQQGVAGGVVLFAFLVGFGLGIYSDKAG